MRVQPKHGYIIGSQWDGSFKHPLPPPPPKKKKKKKDEQ